MIKAKIPGEYKKYIGKHCTYMDTRCPRKIGRILYLYLPKVYVPLYTVNPVQKAASDGTGEMLHMKGHKKNKLVNIESLVADEDFLVIKGDTGCGKTTILKHIAYTIIEEKNYQGLSGYLPVLVFLREIKTIVSPDSGRIGNAGYAESLLDAYCRVTGCGLSVEVIKAFCSKGRVLFLIDGLDEIPEEIRNCVVDSFADFSLNYSCCKIVLTTRPHGISSAVEKRYLKKIIPVLPFNDGQIISFIIQWWYEVYLYDHSRIGIISPETLALEFVHNPDIEEFTQNPLMLTVICFLYPDNRCLGQRADLYERFIRKLLVLRFRNSGYSKIEKYFRQLAHSMFINGNKEIDRCEAVRLLAPYFRTKDASDEEEEIEKNLSLEEYFDHVEATSGLMKISGSGNYGFSYQSIRDYLTAACILDSVETDYSKKIMDFIDQPAFAGMVLFYISLLSVKGNSGIANRIVIDILEQKKEYSTWVLGGKALLDIHKDHRGEKTIILTREKMKEIIETRSAPQIMAGAGEILGRLGDDRDFKVFIKVKGGEYDLEGLGKVKIDDFELGKYLVTNNWYGEFMEAGGYENKGYWTEKGWKWREKNDVREPEFRHSMKFNCPNAPVVGVSWYEAVAFTNWLTLMLNDGYVYRLPVEQEWMAAAAGRKGNKYPWGNRWDKDRCNCSESGLQRTTAVGIFASGNTPKNDPDRIGVFSDMAGNVWEWTSSFYDENNNAYTVHGGSGFIHHTYCRCAVRCGLFPRSVGGIVGFRCARTV